MDEIAYNTRKMVDYLEMAAGEGGEDEGEEPLEKVVEKAVGGEKDAKVQSKLKSIEEQNKALIESLNSLSSQLGSMKGKTAGSGETKEDKERVHE